MRRFAPAITTIAAIGLAAAGFLSVGGAAPAGAAENDPVIDRTISDPRIVESSGLAASRLHPGVIWTHNDSGDTARIFAIGRDGKTVATFRLAGQEPRDWEAIAPGRDAKGRPALFVGDIGDNASVRDRGILVHVVTEPARLTNGTLRPVSYRLRYPDAPHDAEALLVDPHSNRLYVVTKDLLGAAVYAAPQRLSAAQPNILQRIASAPTLVTDGSFLPDGRIVLRNYTAAYVYSRPGVQVARIPLPVQEQGESLTYAPGGKELLVGSEGVNSPVWRVPLPSAQTTARVQAAKDNRRTGIYVGAGVLIAVFVAGLCARGWRRSRRRRVAR